MGLNKDKVKKQCCGGCGCTILFRRKKRQCLPVTTSCYSTRNLCTAPGDDEVVVVICKSTVKENSAVGREVVVNKNDVKKTT